MTGGILQLVVRGYDDLYMIKNPEITYFKIVYRRHTNFSIQPKILKFSEDTDFGQIGICKIKLLGDLLSKVYLGINLPEIDISDDYYTINDVQQILKNYDINYINSDSKSKIKLYVFYDIRNLIIQKLKELYSQYNTETSIKIKKYILLQLNKLGFNNNGCWSFPELKDLFLPNFTHNELSLELYNIFKTGKPGFSWIRELLHYLVEYVEVNIGGAVIDKHNSEVIRSLNILNLEDEKINGYRKMIGDIEELIEYNSNVKSSKILYLPLRFWFCNHFSEALPIVAMPYSPIEITVKFRNFEDVSVSTSYKFKKKPKLDVFLLAHYIYVDEDERKRLCENKQEYLIETIESGHEEIYNETNISESKDLIENKLLGTVKNEYVIDYKLGFNFTTKAIFWIVKPYKNKNKFDKFNWNFNILNTTQSFNPITRVKFKFNGRDRETIKSYGVYQYLHPYNFFNNSAENLFVYSFALYPQMLQPSGTANFGKLADASISLYLNDILINNIINESFKFRITSYAIHYNILRIFSGIGGVAFNVK